MATRDINTRIILEGEREYRNAMKSISAEYKTLQSAMKLTEAQFKNQQNTMNALVAKQKNLQDIVGKLNDKLKLQQEALKKSSDMQKQFSDKAEEARKKIDEKQKRLEALRKTTDDTTKEEDELQKEIAELTKEYNLNAHNAERCQQDTEKYKDEINKTEKELVDYNDQLQKNGKYLDEASKSADGCATSIDETGKELKVASDEGQDFGTSLAGSIGMVKGALAAAGITVAIRAIVNAIKECTAASIAFESAMAGVAKTNNLEGEALAEMSNKVLELSKTMPIAATEFAGIMETAGQLGVANEDLIEFSKTMANLGVATNMTTEEAATMLAQFTAITGMDPSKYGNLGATVVALGNNFATTEQRIVEMSQGIAAAGFNAGLSEAQMMALSTAVSSVGIQSAAGGTNLSGLIQKMQNAVETGEDLNLWADACGMKTYELAGLWRTDASQAILSFFQNVSNGSQPMAVMLDQLGLSDKRMSRLVTSVASAERESGMLSRALGLANQAWEENNALTKEAATRYNTTQSKLALMNNQIEVAKVKFGDSFKVAVGEASDGISTFYGEVEELAESDAWEEIAEKAGRAFGKVAEIGAESVGTFKAMIMNMTGDTEGAQQKVFSNYAKYHKEFYDSVTETWYTLDNAQNLNAETVERLSGTYSNFADVLAGWAEEGVVSKDLIVETTVAIDEQAQKTGEDLTEVDEKLRIQLETQNAFFEEMIKAYDEYYANAKNVADNAFGLFEKVDVKWEKSSRKADKEVQNLSKNLQSQAGFWNRYTENISKAMEEGIDVGLILKLADGSVENAKYLDLIVNASGTARDDLVRNFQSVDEGTDAFADAVALLQLQVDGYMDQIEGKVDETVDSLNQYTAAYNNTATTASAVVHALDNYYRSAKTAADKYKTLMSGLGSSSNLGRKSSDKYSSHAAGLEYVPYDEYPALLHKGEMVLTRIEAEAYRAAEKLGGTQNTSNTYNSPVSVNVNGPFFIRDDSDIDAISESIARDMSREMRYRGSAVGG